MSEPVVYIQAHASFGAPIATVYACSRAERWGWRLARPVLAIRAGATSPLPTPRGELPGQLNLYAS